jgi:hypothetical protein
MLRLTGTLCLLLLNCTLLGALDATGDLGGHGGSCRGDNPSGADVAQTAAQMLSRVNSMERQLATSAREVAGLKRELIGLQAELAVMREAHKQFGREPAASMATTTDAGKQSQTTGKMMQSTAKPTAQPAAPKPTHHQGAKHPSATSQWNPAPIDGHALRLAIKNAQEPPDCNTARFFVTPKHMLGFTNIMTSIARYMRHSVASREVLVVTGRLGNYGTVGGTYHTLFQKETSCPGAMYESRPLSQRDVAGRALFYNHARLLSNDGMGAVTMDQLQGHILRWLMRPTDWFARHLDQTMDRINYPKQHAESVIGIHIRRGDKVAKEKRERYTTEVYIRMAMDLALGATEAAKTNASIPVPSVIFIATDEPDLNNLLAEAQAELAKEPKLQLRIVVHRDVLRDIPADMGMSQYLRGSSPEKGLSAASDIAIDLLLLAESDYLVGTSTSAVSMTAAFLRFARFDEQRKRPPHTAIQIEPMHVGPSTMLHVLRLHVWTDRVHFKREQEGDNPVNYADAENIFRREVARQAQLRQISTAEAQRGFIQDCSNSGILRFHTPAQVVAHGQDSRSAEEKLMAMRASFRNAVHACVLAADSASRGYPTPSPTTQTTVPKSTSPLPNPVPPASAKSARSSIRDPGNVGRSTVRIETANVATSTPRSDTYCKHSGSQWCASSTAAAHPALMAIAEIQNPTDCANVVYSKPTARRAGFAAIVTTWARHMRFTLVDRRVLVISGPLSHYERWDKGGTPGFAYRKLFLNATSCDEQYHKDHGTVMAEGIDKWGGNVDQHKNIVKIPGMESVSMDELQGHALRWLMRPTDWFARHLDQTMDAAGFPKKHTESVIGIHIRRGDKVIVEKRLSYTTEVYMRLAMDLALGATEAAKTNASIPVPSVIFIATDEPDLNNLLAEAQAELAKEPKLQLRIVVLKDMFRNVPADLGMVQYLRTLTEQSTLTRAGVSASERERRLRQKQEMGLRAVTEIATDLFLLAECEYLVGTATSTVSMAAAFMRAGRFGERNMRPPHKAIQVEAMGLGALGTEHLVRRLMWTDHVEFNQPK